MKDIVKLIDERSGRNYHEVEYKFHLTNSLMLDGCHFREKYYMSCNKSTFAWIYCMYFPKVSYEGTYACMIYMNRFDNLLTPIKVNFTLTLRNSIGLVCSAFYFPETEIVSGQEIQQSFNPILQYPTLLRMAGQPLDITLRFRFSNCHNNKRERDNSPNSDEGCIRSAKQSKL